MVDVMRWRHDLVAMPNMDELSVKVVSAAFTSPVDVAALAATERIGGLFEFCIDIVALDSNGFDAEQLAGAPAVLEMWDQNGVRIRFVEGIFIRVAEWLDSQSDVPFYRLVLVPQAYLLSLVRTQQVYLDMSVPEIIEEKLGLIDLPFRLDLGGTYAQREIVVQHGETDLAFLSRLCEHLGISFYFEEGANDTLVMVFTDDQRFWQVPSDRAAVPFRTDGLDKDVFALERVVEVVQQLYMVADYNHRTPLVDMSAVTESSVAMGGGQIEFGGHFKTPMEGDHLATVRRQEKECGHIVFRGKTDRPDLFAGAMFTLEGYGRYGDVGLLVTECTHSVTKTVQGATESTRFVNEFVAIEKTVPFRPARSTPRPTMAGVVNATVMPKPGTDGTQPWLDDDGRYTVRLLFDTAEHGGKSSHKVRMAQAHAGPDFGIHFPLRPGTEVLLVFVNGDPDRPIIVGAVPNAVTPSPVTSGDALFHRIKTASGVKIEIEDGY